MVLCWFASVFCVEAGGSVVWGVCLVVLGFFGFVFFFSCVKNFLTVYSFLCGKRNIVKNK